MTEPRVAFAFNLQFAEQVEFFRKKTNITTQHWYDLQRVAHDRAFTVAGAMKAQLLADLREAVRKGVEDGGTLGDFREEFREIVRRHGWTGWKGEGTAKGEAWRTRVIFETNVITSRAAGRYAQLTDPEFVEAYPYWQYVHDDAVTNPRVQHKAWGDAGLTLPHDHPFWVTNYPPNGWYCHCTVRAVSAPAPGCATEPPKGWNVPDPKTGMPPGIHKGWDYAPGRSRAKDIRKILAEQSASLPPDLAAAFEREAERAFATPVTLPEMIEEGMALLESMPKQAAMLRGATLSAYESGLAPTTANAGPLVDQLKAAVQNSYPREWVEASNRYTYKIMVAEAEGPRGSYTAGDPNDPRHGLTRLLELVFDRPHMARHEFAHRLQEVFPQMNEYFAELHRQRTEGKPLVSLRELTGDNRYEPDEMARVGGYPDPYFGREYNGRPNELMAKSFEYILGNAERFNALYNKDRELFHLTLALLLKWRPR